MGVGTADDKVGVYMGKSVGEAVVVVGTADDDGEVLGEFVTSKQ